MNATEELILKFLGKGWTLNQSFTYIHHGIDLGAALGTPIPAFASGKVVYAGNVEADPKSPWYNEGGGNVVNVDTGNGIIEQYAHLSSIDVKVGDVITHGTIIGKVGQTGNATGPHLHFATFNKSENKFVNPSTDAELFIGTAGKWLDAWMGIVTLPEGKILTEEDVNGMIVALDNVHFFNAGLEHDPVGEALSENEARDKTRQILMSHVGEAWTPELEQKLQIELFGAANAAVDNPINHFLGDLMSGVLWFKIGAVILGAVLIYKGATTIVNQGTGATT